MKPFIFLILLTIPHPELPSLLSQIHFLLSGNTTFRTKILVDPFASRRSNPLPVNKGFVFLIFDLLFESNPGCRDQSTLRTNETEKQKHNQRNNHSKATCKNFYFII